MGRQVTQKCRNIAYALQRLSRDADFRWLAMPSAERRVAIASAAPHLIALAIYTLLGILLTWPLALNVTNGVIGAVGGVDAYQNAWNLWWVARALTSLHNPFFSPLLFYPDGVDLFWQPLGFSQGVLALPVTLTLGPVAAVNWIVLTSFTVGGYATFLFVRRVTGNAAAALIAGATFVCSPYHMEKVIDGNLEVAAIHWLPFYAYALFLLLDSPSWRRALAAGALLIWVSLGSWYYGLFAAIATACAAGIWAYGVIRTSESNQRLRRGLQQVAWGIAPLLIWALALTPALFALLTAGADETLWDMRQVQRERAADLIDVVLPSPVHPWWGPAIRTWRNQVYPNAVIWNVALGWMALSLGLLGAFVARRDSWRWSLLALACLIFALGPELKIAGWRTGLPLPYALIQDMPVIRSGQRPNHMAVMVSLSLSVLAAYGFIVVQQRFAQRTSTVRVWCMALTLIALVAGIDGYAGPHAIVERRIHPFYMKLSGPDGALIPLPLYLNVNRSENLTAQMGHGRPIIGGYVARPPAYSFTQYTPGVREIRYGEVERQDIVSPGWPESARRALAAYRFRYITMDLQSGADNYFARVRSLLAEMGITAPVFADETLEVYAVPDTWKVTPVVFLGDGWKPLERQPDRTASTSAARRERQDDSKHTAESLHRWGGADNAIWLVNPYDAPMYVKLALTLESYETARPVELWHGSRRLAHWEVQRPVRTYHVGATIPPGQTILRLRAPTTYDPYSRRELSVVALNVRIADYVLEPK